jgi:hypothetical protein
MAEREPQKKIQKVFEEPNDEDTVTKRLSAFKIPEGFKRMMPDAKNKSVLYRWGIRVSVCPHVCVRIDFDCSDYLVLHLTQCLLDQLQQKKAPLSSVDQAHLPQKWYCMAADSCVNNKVCYDFKILGGAGQSKKFATSSATEHLKYVHGIQGELPGTAVAKNKKSEMAIQREKGSLAVGADRYSALCVAKMHIARFLPFTFIECPSVRTCLHPDTDMMSGRHVRKVIGETYLRFQVRGSNRRTIT